MYISNSYSPQNSKVVFSSPLDLSTWIPTRHLKHSLQMKFLFFPLAKPAPPTAFFPCHLTSVSSFQLLRPPELGVNLHCFLSFVLHIQSDFLQKRYPESDLHSLPPCCPLLQAARTCRLRPGLCLCSCSLQSIFNGAARVILLK